MNILSLLTAFGIIAVTAPAETFDLASFQPPRGWRIENRGDSTAYVHIDEVAQTYCMLAVYRSTASSGNLAEDYAREWVDLLRRAFTVGPPPRPVEGRTTGGLSYLEGTAAATQGAVRSWIDLMVFPAGKRVVSVLFLATDQNAMSARRVELQAFLDSLRISADNPGIPPRAVPSADSRGAYRVPAGWTRTERDGTVTLSRVVDLGFGVKQDFRLVPLASEAVSGTPVAMFQDLWRRYMGTLFAGAPAPLPLRVRLASGAALLYDGHSMRLRQNNASLDGGFLYAVFDGSSVLPVMGFFQGRDQSLDRDLRLFFDSVRTPGGGGRTVVPLFTGPEIAGVWRSSSSTLANWVDVQGNYRGDASIATGETFTIRSDGTYESQFAAVGGGAGRMRQHDIGRFLIEDDMLVLQPGGSAAARGSRHRITGVGRSADGRGSFLLLGITRDDFPALSAGSRRPGAGDLYVGAR